MPGPAIDQTQLNSVASKIAREINTRKLGNAEGIAQSICAYRDGQLSKTDRKALRHDIAKDVYLFAERDIAAILSKNGYTACQEDIKRVCIEEVSDALKPLMLKFSGTEHPGAVELEMQDGTRGFKAALKASIIEAIQECVDQQEKHRQAAEVHAILEERKARRESRGWVERIVDFFKW